MQVENVPIDSISPDPANVMTHPERNLETIKASLRRFKQQKPIVVDGNGVVRAGNGTLAAAKALGWSHIDIVRTELTGVDAAAYAVVDNRSAELAEWDDGALYATLQALECEIPAIDLGFTIDEFKALAPETTGNCDPDEVPEPPTEPITKPGDLWIMEGHRLLCGDSTDPASVARLMNGEKAILLATDPPYGVSFQGQKYNPRAKAWPGIKNDEHRGDGLTEWLKGVWGVWLQHVSPDFAFYCWTAAKTEYCAAAAAAAAAAFISIQSQIIWVKNVFVLGQSDYHWAHENCLYGFFKGKKHRWLGGRDKRTTWMVDKIANGAYEHPTQKPVELFLIPMRNHTHAGEVCAEPFSGSGTQFIAATELNRRCFGMEIEPAYCDVAVRRWEKFTGKSAKRETV